MKNKLAKATKIVVCLFSLFSLTYGCKEERIAIEEYDTLIYYNDDVVFSSSYITNYDDGTAYISTTVTVPGDIEIIDYGHCWVTWESNPTIDDSHTSFGATSLKSFTISSKINNYSTWSTYYLRAYIETENGIIYDITGRTSGN